MVLFEIPFLVYVPASGGKRRGSLPCLLALGEGLCRPRFLYLLPWHIGFITPPLPGDPSLSTCLLHKFPQSAPEGCAAAS